MSADPSSAPRTRIDPLVAGVSDGVSHGYRGLERVFEGLSEAFRLQGATGPFSRGPAAGSSAALGGRSHDSRSTPTAAKAPGAAGETGAAIVGDAARLVSEMMGFAGSLAQELAHSIAVQSPVTGQSRGDGSSVAELTTAAAAGTDATVQLTVWNTGNTVLRDVVLGATDLIGAGGRIGHTAVTFTPDGPSTIPIGSSSCIEAHVSVPPPATPGVYRGLVQVEPGDTAALLTLTVTAAAPAGGGGEAAGAGSSAGSLAASGAR